MRVIKNDVYISEHFRLDFNEDETLKMVRGIFQDSRKYLPFLG